MSDYLILLDSMRSQGRCQTYGHGEHPFMTGSTGGTATRPSHWSAGDGEDGKGYSTTVEGLEI